MLSQSNLYAPVRKYRLGFDGLCLGTGLTRIHLPSQSLCKIGKDCEGNWVVQGPYGQDSGLFANRAEGLRFAMFENGYPHAVVMLPRTLELNITQGT